MALEDLRGWIHHDGSALYLSDNAPEVGQAVAVRLRGPAPFPAERVFLRTVHDGEPRIVQAVSQQIDGETWWSAALTIRNPRTHYRWLLEGGELGYVWLNAGGLVPHDTSDAADFVVHASPAPPAWLKSAVVYQVFPDRFASSGRQVDVPEWAVPRPWGKHPEGRSANTPVEYFGGDLWAAAERLPHLMNLGVNVLYMTPFFPAASTHRYDASTFDHVDPLLGGDEALAALISAAHELGIRVMGDITLNHCGREHEWFRAALKGEAPYRDFFTFDDSLEHGYECWLGVPSLPKFNYASLELRRRLISDNDSVLRRWLRFGLDGWRVDVANMSGRQAELDLTHEVARLARAAVEAEGADKALIAEHFHDAGPDLDGDGWHGGMNYGAFMNPIWTWLRSDTFTGNWQGIPVRAPSQTGTRAIAALTSFSSRMPWRSYQHSWPLLGSHDTARVRSVVGSRDLQRVACTLLMTMPGTPMIFSGDEIGAEGLWGEDARTCFPWDQPESWDQEILEDYRELIRLRRTSPALTDGGMRWIVITDDTFAYLRESPEERLLIVVARATDEQVRLDWSGLQSDGFTSVFGVEPRLIGAELWFDLGTQGVSVCRLD